MEIIIWP